MRPNLAHDFAQGGQFAFSAPNLFALSKWVAPGSAGVWSVSHGNFWRGVDPRRSAPAPALAQLRALIADFGAGFRPTPGCRDVVPRKAGRVRGGSVDRLLPNTCSRLEKLPLAIAASSEVLHKLPNACPTLVEQLPWELGIGRNPTSVGRCGPCFGRCGTDTGAAARVARL